MAVISLTGAFSKLASIRLFLEQQQDSTPSDFEQRMIDDMINRCGHLLEGREIPAKETEPNFVLWSIAASLIKQFKNTSASKVSYIKNEPQEPDHRMVTYETTLRIDTPRQAREAYYREAYNDIIRR